MQAAPPLYSFTYRSDVLPMNNLSYGGISVSLWPRAKSRSMTFHTIHDIGTFEITRVPLADMVSSARHRPVRRLGSGHCRAGFLASQSYCRPPRRNYIVYRRWYRLRLDSCMSRLSDRRNGGRRFSVKRESSACRQLPVESYKRSYRPCRTRQLL